MKKKSRPVEVESFQALPHTTLRYRVYLHLDAKSFYAAHRELTGIDETGYIAFWYAYRQRTSDLLGEFHFIRGQCGTDTIAHECFHAGLAAARRMMLDIESDDAEELMVETAENMFKTIRKAFRACK